MSVSVTNVAPIRLPDTISPTQPSGQPGEFQKVLDGAINTMESVNQNAGNAVQKFLTGETEELHSTILATQQASLTFELGLSVRNKVIDAYQEIMRMQI